MNSKMVRRFWCCERFGLKELGPLKSGRWLVDYFGPSSYRHFSNKETEGASESIIEKLSKCMTKNNQPISNPISIVQVHLNQIFHNIETHAIGA